MRMATSEEKHWLNECIKLDKFITFEEAMKTFIPEYVECINPQSWRQTIKENNGNLIFKSNFKSTCSTQIKNLNLLTTTQFKPSTKEAYDAQFIVKEPEFVLPEKWAIIITNENKEIVNNYRKQLGLNIRNLEVDWVHLSERHDSTYFHYNKNYFNKHTSCIEITFEQFKKYVLKEEVIEEKVIEPLPQFKVIETIETITKVENNEGNQFFIGDLIKTSLGLQYNIIGFEYNENKSNILAILDNSLRKDINEIEHYIKPKVEVKPEFVLPEKWCLKITKENLDFCRNLENNELGFSTNYNYTIGGYYSSILNQGCYGFISVPINFQEITFDQFKKYVLKTEVKEETLLEKAKRLYPVGTKYKCATNFTLAIKVVISTLNYHKFNNTGNEMITDGNGGSVYYNGIWAEIIN